MQHAAALRARQRDRGGASRGDAAELVPEWMGKQRRFKKKVRAVFFIFIFMRMTMLPVGSFGR